MFVTGSMLNSLLNLNHLNPCGSFMKPGTDWEPVARRVESACNCTKEVGGGIGSCRDIDENGCKPSAHIDCKIAVQEMNNIWIEGAIRDIFCSYARGSTHMLALTCNN